MSKGLVIVAGNGEAFLDARGCALVLLVIPPEDARPELREQLAAYQRTIEAWRDARELATGTRPRRYEAVEALIDFGALGEGALDSVEVLRDRLFAAVASAGQVGHA